MKTHNTQIKDLKESIFSTITQQAIETSSINLAQGFPDFEGPDWMIELAEKALRSQKNQYAPSMGVMELREQLSQHYHKRYGLSYHSNEILITHGATEAIYCTLRALLNPGDEVVIFEPLYDSYAATIKMAQGVVRPVTLKKPDFNFNWEEFERTLNDRTKVVIINNPHNPTGRIFSKFELQRIAELAEKFDFYILSDEVYEFLNFSNNHIPTASIENLRERTITISSIGKTLSFTGWKIGWACAPEAILKSIHSAHQYVNFCVNHPLQIATQEIIATWDAYLLDFQKSYFEKRQRLLVGLQERGLTTFTPQGTYFLLCQVPNGYDDWSFCRYLISKHKVATIPLSPFYHKSTEGESMVRFCFAKTDSVIDSALQNLKDIER